MSQERAQTIIDEAWRAGLKVPRQVIFGRGVLNRLPEIVEALDTTGPAMVLAGGRSFLKSGLKERLENLLRETGLRYNLHAGINREPTVAMVDQAAARAREMAPGLIISIGGGSVMDCGKAVAALAVNAGSVEDYLEGVGRGFKLERPPLPHIAIPTVAGTGAEATKNAVVASLEQGFKKSMRDDRMLPSVALVDPALTITVDKRVTAAGGLDAITQLIEPCISARRRPETTRLAQRALTGIRAALPACWENPSDLAARAEMSLASLVSGICLANSGLAMAHGLAAALGALHDFPHGLACGLMLPHTLRFNRDACPAEMASALGVFLGTTGDDDAVIDRGITAIEELNRRLGIPADLKFLRLTAAQLDRLAHASMGSSMSGNPKPVTPQAALEFLRALA